MIQSNEYQLQFVQQISEDVLRVSKDGEDFIQKIFPDDAEDLFWREADT
jgi:serine/threonine protein kinase